MMTGLAPCGVRISPNLSHSLHATPTLLGSLNHVQSSAEAALKLKNKLGLWQQQIRFPIWINTKAQIAV